MDLDDVRRLALALPDARRSATFRPHVVPRGLQDFRHGAARRRRRTHLRRRVRGASLCDRRTSRRRPGAMGRQGVRCEPRAHNCRSGAGGRTSRGFMAPTRTEACSRRLRRVTSESLRHAGHADIVRELIDGSVGILDGHHNLRVSERALPREFRNQVQDAARLAGGERSHSPVCETPGMTKSPLAKAWTDHNTSDPGITVLEVLAYSSPCWSEWRSFPCGGDAADKRGRAPTPVPAIAEPAIDVQRVCDERMNRQVLAHRTSLRLLA